MSKFKGICQNFIYFASEISHFQNLDLTISFNLNKFPFIITFEINKNNEKTNYKQDVYYISILYLLLKSLTNLLIVKLIILPRNITIFDYLNYVNILRFCK